MPRSPFGQFPHTNSPVSGFTFISFWWAVYQVKGCAKSIWVAKKGGKPDTGLPPFAYGLWK
jgi:hypothetical protein